jgi:hypothetical protein
MTLMCTERGRPRLIDEKSLMGASSMKTLPISPLKCKGEMEKTLISIPLAEMAR